MIFNPFMRTGNSIGLMDCVREREPGIQMFRCQNTEMLNCEQSNRIITLKLLVVVPEVYMFVSQSIVFVFVFEFCHPFY